MRMPVRSGLATVLWLTLYVGVLPFGAILAAMLLAREFLDLDESWGVVFSTIYVGLLLLGGRAFAQHFERRR